MKVIPPIEITDSVLVSSSVLENDYAAWAAATTYATGTKVIYLHKVYESLADGNIGFTPGATASIEKWLDCGRTNRWKMLSFTSNDRTETVSPLVVTLTPGQRITAVALLGVSAETATVSVSNGTDIVYEYTTDLRYRETVTWRDYFFGAFSTRESAFTQNVPPITSAQITVTLSHSSGTVKCGAVILGNPVDLGDALSGASVGMVDYSRIERDAFGNASLLQRKSTPKTSQTTVLRKAEINKVRNTLNSLRANIALWLGVESEGSRLFDSLAVFGLCTQFDIDLTYPDKALLTLDIQGL